jgi:hypothetical protein
VPNRVQQRRTKGWRKGPNDVYVGRPSKWGNPHAVSPPATAADIERYRTDLLAGRLRFTVDDVQRELRGKNLACWCALDAPCHADVLLEIANQ